MQIKPSLHQQPQQHLSEWNQIINPEKPNQPPKNDGTFNPVELRQIV